MYVKASTNAATADAELKKAEQKVADAQAELDSAGGNVQTVKDALVQAQNEEQAAKLFVCVIDINCVGAFDKMLYSKAR